ncbi:hypothetical protein E2C01_095940 [Portunus trituberculatus]|uniref:Uncharacterized protein n=1 Tax=Portunus trituberculatus TaxID=210409 RepID=A0A5B7K1Q7_PORTR|nr:hypothetical protein [Portunus trituberculatus]
MDECGKIGCVDELRSKGLIAAIPCLLHHQGGTLLCTAPSLTLPPSPNQHRRRYCHSGGEAASLGAFISVPLTHAAVATPAIKGFRLAAAQQTPATTTPAAAAAAAAAAARKILHGTLTLRGHHLLLLVLWWWWSCPWRE